MGKGTLLFLVTRDYFEKDLSRKNNAFKKASRDFWITLVFLMTVVAAFVVAWYFWG